MAEQVALKRRKRIAGLNPNIFFLGLVSLLNDFSSEMIFTLLPLFLANVLGASSTIIGLIGGVSGSADAFFRIFSGWFSDRMGRRKPLTVLGYSLSTIAKPFMYIASSWGAALAIRFTDRMGKGIRNAPRDALVADSVTAGDRGRGFGLHRAMDTSGAVLGLAGAAVIVYLVEGAAPALTLRAFHWMVLVGMIPAVLGVLVLLALVHESRKARAVPGASGSTSSTSAGGLDTRFKLFLVIVAVFTLGNTSDFFVILRAQNLGSSVIYVTLMLILFNVTYAVSAMPAGILSDRLGRRRLIVLGWVVFALVYIGFAVASQPWHVWLLFAIYGVYYGLVEGVSRAFVADLVPAHKRGTAYGWYHGVLSLALLPAGLIAGWMWSAISPASTFYFGAAMAFLAALGIMTLIRE